MTRTAARELAIRLVFSMNVTGQKPAELLEEFFEQEYFGSLSPEDDLFENEPDETQLEYISRLVTLCHAHEEELGNFIGTYAKGWKPERISSTASAVIRCAMCEILYMDDIPDSAAINEAVELAKGYDDPDTVAFINGVLGGFIRGEKPESAPQAE